MSNRKSRAASARTTIVLRWRHGILNARCSWLHGDERGFRSRDHRIHSSGDYKHKPHPTSTPVCARFHQERSGALAVAAEEHAARRPRVAAPHGLEQSRPHVTGRGHQHALGQRYAAHAQRAMAAPSPTAWKRGS